MGMVDTMIIQITMSMKKKFLMNSFNQHKMAPISELHPSNDDLSHFENIVL